MKAAAKAKLENFSDSALLTAELRPIAVANVSKDQIGTRVHMHKRLPSPVAIQLEAP